MPETRPYGTWRSPLSAADLAQGLVALSDLRVDRGTEVDGGGALLWTELRPGEGGRQVVVRHDGTGRQDVTPSGGDTRTRVHEYGGAPYAVRDGLVVGSEFADQRLYRLAADGAGSVTGGPPSRGAVRFADGEITPDGRYLLCVRETHPPLVDADEAVNEIVAVDLRDGGEHVLVSGRDFVASPRLGPDGTSLAWLAWDHPDMPWDAAEAWIGRIGLQGRPTLADPRRVAGGDGVSVAELCWHPGLGLLVSSDQDGWWQLHVAAPGGTRRVTTLRHDGEPTDLGHPMWQLGGSTMAVLPDGAVAVAPVQRARSLLGVVDPGSGEVTWTDSRWTRIDHLHARGEGVVFVGSAPDVYQAVVQHDLAGGEELVREVALPQLRDGDVPEPEAIVFATGDGARAHGLLHRPANAAACGPDDELPPLTVRVHGGPTGNAYPTLDPEIVYWTSRGFAVVDVNYRGSTGYGRAYRDALAGRWGVVDVEDAMAAARDLGARGAVDADRMAIRGGSAGGYTVLMAVTEDEQVFVAGGNHFGVADLAMLAEHTHKFESRYLDRLVGPFPEAEELYEERSPLARVDRLRTPLIVFQGDEDEVVPPEQSRAIVEAARERGVPHAYLEFEGEQHGFRKAQSIVRSLEAELVFYGRIMGFEPAGDLPDVDIEGLDRRTG